MTIGDIIGLCEYVNCKVLDAFGNEIKVTTDDYDELTIEHLSAKDNEVLIWTFDKWDEYEEYLINNRNNK